ncbi:MAG: DUF5591 domain-containing protein [Candidatus Lokiarchaeota archaeon]|nr:DUF5591 domain-containing protein [Candidatus Lokiarchaeota archaeon]
MITTISILKKFIDFVNINLTAEIINCIIMIHFFELIKNGIGLSRIGKIKIHKSSKKSIYTPNIIIPFKQFFSNNAEFIDSFGCHDIFIISEEKYLKEEILNKRFGESFFLYTHYGTLQKFQEILEEKKEIFHNSNIIPIIPFNIPTISINKKFSENEIKNHLKNIEIILKDNPNINFGLSIKIYKDFDLFNLYISLIENNINIKILNFIDLFKNLTYYRRIIDLIKDIKENLDNNLVLMASGTIISNYLPILVYFGFDLVDSSYSLLISSNNLYESIETLLPISKIKFLPCSCLSCEGKLSKLLGEKHSTEKIDLLCYHNLLTIKNYMNKTVQYLHTEDFRNFVEKSSLNNPNFISLLRIFDKAYYNFTKNYSQLNQKNKIINCLGPSSYYRPDFNYFRNKINENFEPESWTKLIVLFPCSAKKPYSLSKSHKKFLKILRKIPEFPAIQEIILTSPLGLIPRQLEDIYPAHSYDIPVTGDWDNEEIKISSKMLIRVLNKFNKDIPIICHLNGRYLDIVNQTEKEIEHKFFYTDMKEHPTSNDSLDHLNILIQKHISSYLPDASITKENYLSNTWLRKFKKIIDFQFGSGLGTLLINNEIKYRKNKLHTKIEIFNSNTKSIIGNFEISSGKIQLAIKGAEKIAFEKDFLKYIVFDGSNISGNTLFRPGIIDFSSDLYTNDNVCIFDKEKKNVIGMGNMIVSSEFIKNTTSGRVVKLYEIKK